MRHGRDDEHRGEERDVALGKALDKLDAPEYPPDFLASVWARVDAADEAAETTPARSRRKRPRWFRRPVLATAAAAVAISVVVALAVLVGMPGISQVGGPEPVSAAQVIQKALRAMSSGRTLVMDITEKDANGVVYPAGVPEFTTTHVRLVMRADGSYRLVQTDVAPASMAGGRPRKGYEGGVYDATTGVYRHYVTGWEEDAGRYMHELEVTTGWPPGPPDSWTSMESGLTSVALALQAGGRATLTTTTFDGRPVWVITATGVMALRDKTEVDAVTIDRRTCLPLRVRSWKDGVLQLDYAWRYVGRDEPLPEGTFTSVPVKGMKVTRSDAGFRRLPIARIASMRGYVALLPTWLPAGYRQQWVAAAKRSTTANGVTRGRNVVALQYGRGFDGLTITTRTVTDPGAAVKYDPVEWDMTYADLVHTHVRLTGGDLAGVTAQVVVAPGTMIPHLYAVKDHLMLTVAGAATSSELVAIAESLQLYPGHAASPPASPLGSD